MLGMRRFQWILLVAFALLIAIEPVVHSHPIGSDTQCAICAAGNQRIAEPPPAIAAPNVVIWTLTIREVALPAIAGVNALPSRSPPSV